MPTAAKMKARAARQRETARRFSRERSEAGFDIGKIPKITNRARRNRCKSNLQLFLETYLADTFNLAWSQDQIDAIKILQTVILEGGQFALAMYRGGGKTALCRGAALWAELYGHRKFVVIIGATGDAATEILDAIQAELETNDLLYADFPEAIHPIRALDGEPRKCARQSYRKKRTEIEWGKDVVVFARIPGAAASGGIIRVVGIEGRLRGMSHRNQRPDCLLIDDPQTDESAASPTGNAKRRRIIQRTALKLAGPRKRIACMMPCTIIFPGDMVDQFTDRQRHPEWNGERRKLVLSFPTNKELWERYREVRAEGMRRGDNGRAATEFYLANREALDAGCVVAWPEFTKGKASAIQYAMDEFIDDPDGAAAELNNDPKHETITTDLRQLAEDDLAMHQNNLSLSIVPRDCNKLTAFIDVGQELVFWMVCAWSDSFGGAIVDYGSFPEQPTPIFEPSALPNPLSKVMPGIEEKARIYRAIQEMVGRLSSRTYPQQDADGRLSISLGLIDSGKWADTVHEVLARSPFKALWKASKGRSIDPNSKPLNDYIKHAGDVVGWNWRIDAQTTAKGRFVSFDTRPWKSQVVNSLLASPGTSTSIYLPGARLTDHPLLMLHLLAEYRAELKGSITGRKVEAWYDRPERKATGNHWWDCLVGAAVAASVAGLKHSSAVAAGETPEPEKPAAKVDARAEYERKRREFEARRSRF